jgi:hypothetical protein
MSILRQHAEPAAKPLRRAGTHAGLAVGSALFVAWFVSLAATGSPLSDVARWCAAVFAAVLAPGWVVVRLSRRPAAPMIEDLSWAAPAGCLVALLGWFTDRVLPVSPGAFGLGPVIVLVALLVPAGRRRLFARPAPSWGTRPTLALAGVQLVALGWMLKTGLLAYQPDPGPHGTTYYPDLMYNLDLVGELNHHLNPTYPPVAGASLSYHWFLFAITSHLTTHTGVGLFDATMRLGPASLVPATIMLVAVVARRVANRVWAGPLAAGLLGAVELSQATRWTTEDGSLGLLPRAWFSSTPQALGWVAGLAAAGTAIAFIRRAPEDRAVPAALLVPFLVLAAGSKSPELVVVGAGFGLALLVQLVLRDWRPAGRSLAGVVGCLGVFAAASVTIYRGSSYGLRVRWFGAILDRLPAEFPNYATQVNPYYLSGQRYERVALLAGTLLWVVPLLPRLAGVLFAVRYRPHDVGAWFCLGATVAGFVGALVLRHPAGSEVYFMQSGYPIGVAGAAAGLLLAWDRIVGVAPSPRWRVRYARAALGLIALGLVSAAVIAVSQPRLDPVTAWMDAQPTVPLYHHLSVGVLAWRWLRPMLWCALVAGSGAVVAAVLAHRAAPKGVRLRAPIATAAALCIALGAGVFTMIITFHGTSGHVQGSPAAVTSHNRDLMNRGALPTMRDAFAAGAWVNAHAGLNDVVATNEYCRFDRTARLIGVSPCDARNFVASALTQRHTLVGGWSYADRAVNAAWSQTRARYNNERFWDRQAFDDQFNAVAHPTRALLDKLYRVYHVRWIFADVRDVPVDATALDKLAVRRFAGPSTEVWQLQAPGRHVLR